MHDAQLPHFQNDYKRYAKVPLTWINECSPRQLRVMCALSYHAKARFAFPNVVTLASELNMAMNHVYATLRQLSRIGFIEVSCDDDGNEGYILHEHITKTVLRIVPSRDKKSVPNREQFSPKAGPKKSQIGTALHITDYLTEFEHTAPADAGCALAQSSHETGRTNGGTVSKIVGPITRSTGDAQVPRQNSAPVITETKAFVQARRCALHLATLTRQPPVMDKHWQKLIATHTVDVVLEIIDEAYRNKAKVMKGDFAERNFTRQSVAYYAETYYKAKPALADRVDARTAMIITDIANTRRSDGTYDEQQLRSFFVLSNVRRAEVSELLDAATADRVFQSPNLS